MSLVGQRLCRRIACCAIGALALLVPIVASAVPFGDNGVAIPPIHLPGFDSVPSAVVVQSDGRLVVAGTTYGPLARTMFAARFTANGVLDTSYGAAGIAFAPIPPDASSLRGNAAAIDAQGNLVIVGQVQYPDPGLKQHLAVVRLTPTGMPDPTFGEHGYTEVPLASINDQGYATSVVVDNLGRIVVAGGPDRFVVARLTNTGTLDPSFSATGIVQIALSQYSSAAGSMAVDESGNVVVTGYDSSFASTPVTVVKLTSTGQLDASFNGNGVVQLALGTTSGPFPVAVDSNGGILVADKLRDGYHDTFLVTRLTSTGGGDISFGSGGLAQFPLSVNTELVSMALDSLGRIVVSSSDSVAVRFQGNGTIDGSFNGSGIEFGAGGTALAIDANDNVAFARPQWVPPYAYNQVAISRITSGGLVDSSFNGTGTVVQDCGVQQLRGTALARQPDGKLLIAGSTGTADTSLPSAFIVARLTTDGALDAAFNGTGYSLIAASSGAYTLDATNAMALDAGGNIVLAGHDTGDNFAVARVTQSGVLDTTFNGTGTRIIGDPGFGQGGATAIAIDGQGSIVVVGNPSAADGTGFEVIRLTAAGALDASFANGGIGVFSLGAFTVQQATGVALDSTGRIVVSGWVAPADSSGCSLLAAVRLTSAGTLDSTFAGAGMRLVSLGANCLREVDVLKIDSSDRIVLAGSAFDNPVAVRLTATGALDPTFNGTGIDWLVGARPMTPRAIAFDGAGNVLMAGDYFVAGNYGDMVALRLTPNGAADPTFGGGKPLRISASHGAAVGDRALGVVLDGSGGIYLGGTTGRSMAVVKLFAGTPTALAFIAVNDGIRPLAGHPFNLIIESQDDSGNPQPVEANTSVALSLRSGTGVLSGGQSCLIPAGEITCSIAGAVYSKAESDVVFTVTVSSGDPLDPADSVSLAFDTPGSATLLATSANPSVFGQVLTFTATVIGVGPPTGTVSFTDGGGAIGGCGFAPVLGLINPKYAVCNTASLAVGSHNVVANYGGDARTDPSSSAPLVQVVNSPVNTNIALASAGAIASTSSIFSAAFPASAINNGDRAGLNAGAGGVWKDATVSTFPDWVEIDFNGAQTIDRVIVYSMQDNYLNPVDPSNTLTFTQRGVTAFDVQAWNGSAWATLGSVSGNNLVKRTVSFTATSTNKIRVVINSAAGTYSFLAEVEAWTPSGPPAPGTTLASSLNPTRVGRSVTFTATVTASNPTGVVAFTNGGSSITGCGAVPLTGSGNVRTAQCATSFAAKGTFSIVARYSGDSNNASTTSAALSEVVKKR